MEVSNTNFAKNLIHAGPNKNEQITIEEANMEYQVSKEDTSMLQTRSPHSNLSLYEAKMHGMTMEDMPPTKTLKTAKTAVLSKMPKQNEGSNERKVNSK